LAANRSSNRDTPLQIHHFSNSDPMIAPGDTPPDFTLQTDAGVALTLSAQRGRTVVLYFYPKADTPG
jgi:hypothetical protein